MMEDSGVVVSWHIESRKIVDLRDHSKNPRTLSKHQAIHLEKSLRKFGLIDKPIINLDNGIIGGHQRIRLLKALQIEEVECWVPSFMLNQKEVDELCIRLNKNTGEFCWDTLANLWDGDDLINAGFSEGELLDEQVVTKKKSLKIILEFDTSEGMQDCLASKEFNDIKRFDPKIKVKK